MHLFHQFNFIDWQNGHCCSISPTFTVTRNVVWQRQMRSDSSSYLTTTWRTPETGLVSVPCSSATRRHLLEMPFFADTAHYLASDWCSGKEGNELKFHFIVLCPAIVNPCTIQNKGFKEFQRLSWQFFAGLVPAKTIADVGDCCECQPRHYVLQPTIAMKKGLLTWKIFLPPTPEEWPRSWLAGVTGRGKGGCEWPHTPLHAPSSHVSPRCTIQAAKVTRRGQTGDWVPRSPDWCQIERVASFCKSPLHFVIDSRSHVWIMNV